MPWMLLSKMLRYFSSLWASWSFRRFSCPYMRSLIFMRRALCR